MQNPWRSSLRKKIITCVTCYPVNFFWHLTCIILKSVLKINYCFQFVDGSKKYKNLRKTEGQMSSTLPSKCLQIELSWEAVGWIQRESFLAWEPEGSLGTKVSLKQRSSVSQHFQNGSGWHSIDITPDEKNPLSDLLVLRCVWACMCGFNLTESTWSNSV